MRNVWFVLSLSILFLTSCSSKSEENLDQSLQEEIQDSVLVEPEIDEFETLYGDKLKETCECDMRVGFNIEGEGESVPLYLDVDGEEMESYATGAHLKSYNPEMNRLTLESLEEWSDFDDANLIEYEPNQFVRVAINPVSVYKWPDEKSEEMYEFPFFSEQQLLRCYGNWAKITYQNADSNKKEEGWVLISKHN